MLQSARKLIVFPIIQEMEGCDAGEELNMHMDGSDSDETKGEVTNRFRPCIVGLLIKSLCASYNSSAFDLVAGTHSKTKSPSGVN